MSRNYNYWETTSYYVKSSGELEDRGGAFYDNFAELSRDLRKALNMGRIVKIKKAYLTREFWRSIPNHPSDKNPLVK